MKKKFKNYRFEYYSYPADFFESIGNALALLGNFFCFDISREPISTLGLNKKRKKKESKELNRS